MTSTDARAASVQGEAAATAQTNAQVNYRWRNLLTMTGINVVENAESGLASTLFPTIAKALDLNNGHLGILAAGGKLVAIPFGWAWVALADRTSRRTVLVGSTAIAGVFGVAAGYSQNFLTLVLFNTLMSAALVSSGPIANGLIADSFDDAHRGRATGIYFGAAGVISAALGPVVGQLSRFDDGWRWALWGMSGICIVSSVAVYWLFRDPGTGAAEEQLRDLNEEQRRGERPSLAAVLSLLKIPTYAVMLVSRFFSGQALFLVFGVQFLVVDRGFSNAMAATAVLPYGAGYFLGTVGGGLALAFVDRALPLRGRVLALQFAQVAFAVAAFIGTQFEFDGFGVYMACWGLIGVAQGINPTINRPIIMGSVRPELRTQAFAILMTIAEPLSWVMFAIGAGTLADNLGLQFVFFWVLVVLMLLNAVLMTALYFTYPKDVAIVQLSLNARRIEAMK
ncbi:MFS transporter [Gordonia malaquae]|uniref:MFS transporter n=1 Tax=Gordonia malaquae TaxID=410332 RepID=UPI0030FEC73F